MLKTWWVRGLLGSAAWTAATVGAGMLHTSGLPEAEDAVLSERYGMACGAGIAAILLLCYLLRNRTSAAVRGPRF